MIQQFKKNGYISFSSNIFLRIIDLGNYCYLIFRNCILITYLKITFNYYTNALDYSTICKSDGFFFLITLLLINGSMTLQEALEKGSVDSLMIVLFIICPGPDFIIITRRRKIRLIYRFFASYIHFVS